MSKFQALKNSLGLTKTKKMTVTLSFSDLNSPKKMNELSAQLNDQQEEFLRQVQLSSENNKLQKKDYEEDSDAVEDTTLENTTTMEEQPMTRAQKRLSGSMEAAIFRVDSRPDAFKAPLDKYNDANSEAGFESEGNKTVLGCIKEEPEL